MKGWGLLAEIYLSDWAHMCKERVKEAAVKGRFGKEIRKLKMVLISFNASESLVGTV